MVVSKNRGTPKMDGENNVKPYEQMDDLGGNTPIFGSTPHMTVLHLDIYRFTDLQIYIALHHQNLQQHLLCCSPGSEVFSILPSFQLLYFPNKIATRQRSSAFLEVGRGND